MSVLGKIGEFFGSGAMEVVEKGADIVERWAPGAERKHEMAKEIDEAIESSVDNARKHDQGIGHVGNWFDSVVNGINRLIRPFVTIGLVGGIVGWWELPITDDVDPVILGFTEMVLIFWFGCRALFKDLPALIKYTKRR